MSESGTSATVVRESDSTGSTDAEIAPVENPQVIADFSEAAISDAQPQAAPPGNFENLQSASGASTVSSASSSIFSAAGVAETRGAQSSASRNPEGAHRTDATATLANVSTEFSDPSALDIAALQNPFLPGHFGSAHSADAQSLPNATTFPLQKDTPAQSMFMRASGLSTHGSSDNPASTAFAGDSPSSNFQSSANEADASGTRVQNASGQNPSSQNSGSQNSSAQNPSLRDAGSHPGDAATASVAMTAQPDLTAPANVVSGSALVNPAASAAQSSATGSPSPVPLQSADTRANGVAEAALPESAGAPGTSLVQAAQMMNRAAQSEMRIGLNTPSFGSVEVRTVVQANEVGLVIGSEKGDLHSLLAPEIPGIVGNLQQQNLRLQHVDFQQGSAFSGNLSSGGGDSRPRYFGAPLPVSSSLAESGAEEVAVSTNEIRSIGSSGLNILA